MIKHEITMRVYYEDTDAMGIVYYANYLRFFERARTEWLRDLGFEKSGAAMLGEDKQIAFVVRRCDIRFLKPAYHDDLVRIETILINDEKARILRKKTSVIGMSQHLYRDKLLLVRLNVQLAVIDNSGNMVALPVKLLKFFDE
ncbi:MAG: YbgC/FadM family acyl-CoA thioesterase [Alphaproteobacteria bacterium]|nr:YbgC/FadM family acyl-CoA thioesterase [Alphaproteobacteria bacterium]